MLHLSSTTCGYRYISCPFWTVFSRSDTTILVSKSRVPGLMLQKAVPYWPPSMQLLPVHRFAGCSGWQKWDWYLHQEAICLTGVLSHASEDWRDPSKLLCEVLHKLRKSVPCKVGKDLVLNHHCNPWSYMDLEHPRGFILCLQQYEKLWFFMWFSECTLAWSQAGCSEAGAGLPHYWQAKRRCVHLSGGKRDNEPLLWSLRR